MSRKNARKAGNRFYMGNPCPKGHVGKRYVASSRCVDCEMLKSKEEQRLMVEARERGPVTYMDVCRLRYPYFVADLTHPLTLKALGSCRHDIVRKASMPYVCRVCNDIARRAKLRKGKPGAKVVLDPLDL